MMRRVLLAACLLLSPGIAAAAGPRVDVEVSDTAPELTRRAADELAADLKRLYGAEVRIAARSPEDAIHVIRVESLKFDEQFQHLPDGWRKDSLDRWPKTPEQTHALLSLKYRDKPALSIVGGSPLATYWAAAELSHRLGVRTMLYGDVDPVAPPPFSLEGFDVVLQPRAEHRVWQMNLDSPFGPASWSLAEQRKLLRQLARLKFNRIVFTTAAKTPADAVAAFRPIRVGGDTAGRSAFGGAKFFDNPDLAAAQTDEARHKAAAELIRVIESEAKALGMTLEVIRTLKNNPPLPSGGLLPLKLVTGAHERLSAVLRAKPASVGVQSPSVGDADLAAFLHSRGSFDAKYAGGHPVHDLVTPICGEGVSDRVFKAFALAEEATKLILAGDPAFSAPVHDVVMRHYASSDPPSEWWGKARDNYLNAMNEMYRANTRAREGGRSYTLYFARRFEFAFEYMNAIEAIRKAGIAKGKGDQETQVAELEKAVESMNGALSALAAVARTQSDRGIIAVLNEYGYRPLVKELEAADANQ